MKPLVALTIMCVIATLLLACAERRVSTKTIIPSNCRGPLKVTDFTKPCKRMSDSTMVCDGVIVHYSCVKYEEAK